MNDTLTKIKARCEWGLKPETFNQSDDDLRFYREVLCLLDEVEQLSEQLAQAKDEIILTRKWAGLKGGEK